MTHARYQDLKIWQLGMDLAEIIYSKVKVLPTDERFGLVGQMRRAAVSIPSNIAEGYAHKSKREFKHFLLIALGSIAEIETQILLCQRIQYLKKETCMEMLVMIGDLQRMITSLIKTISTQSKS